MRLLIDTHALLWHLSGDERVSSEARALIADPLNKVLVSAASGWEITTKYRLGKLPQAALIAQDVEGTLTRLGYELLNITMHHAQHAGALPGNHRDPFDRMLAAQAQIEGIAIISGDGAFDGFEVRRLW